MKPTQTSISQFDGADENSPGAADVPDVSDAADPRRLFDAVPVSVEGLTWADVTTPDDTPETAEDAVLGLARHLLQMGGNRTGYSHHEQVRASMRKWAPDLDEPDPHGYREATVSMGPSDRRGRLQGDRAERLQKAEAVIQWAADEYPDGLVFEAAEEYRERLRGKWERAAERAERDALDAEFSENPPEAVNGWRRFETDKTDAILAYAGVTHGTPTVAAVREDGEEPKASAHTLEEWEAAETAADVPLNHSLYKSGRGPFGALRSFLQSREAEPLEGEGWGPTADEPLPEPEQGHNRLNARGFNADVLAEEAAGDREGIHRDDREPAPDYEEAQASRHAEATGEQQRPADLIDGTDADPTGALEVMNSLPDPGKFREKMEEHGETLATDGGNPGLPENWTATAPETTESGSRFFFLKGFYEKPHSTHEKAIIVFRPPDGERGDWAAKSGKGFGRETITFGTGDPAEAAKAGLRAAHDANEDWPTHLDGYGLGERPDLDEIPTPEENIAEFIASPAAAAETSESEEAATDGGQQIERAETDETDGLPGEETPDEYPGEFDPEAETVGAGWEGAYIWTTWGYGQTNVELAKIVDVSESGKTVVAQMVRPKQVGTGQQSYQLAPSDETYGDTFRLHVRSYSGGRRGPTFRGSYPYLNSGEMDEGTRRAGFSWWGKNRSHISETATQYGH